MVEPGSGIPPDDTGSSTAARYRYQAEVAFPYCLACALDDDITAVIPEHYEDIALEYSDHWRFLQVKTKGTGLEHWTLNDITAKKGGVDSLYRSYCSLQGVALQMELIVEGGLRPSNDIRHLVRGAERDLEKVEPTIRSALQRLSPTYDDAICDAFLECLSVRANPYHRLVIGDANYRTLSSHGSLLGVTELNRIHTELMTRIESAMRADAIHDWPQVLVDESVTPESTRRYRAKRLTKESFADLVVQLARPPQPLLKLAVSPDGQPPGPMVQKLLLGGASPTIVDDAKRLRSESAIRQYEQLSASPSDDSALEDVQARLLTLANAVKVRHSAKPAPADHIWADLLDRLVSSAATFDPNGFFAANPFLLLGEICEMSDACTIDWN